MKKNSSLFFKWSLLAILFLCMANTGVIRAQQQVLFTDDFAEVSAGNRTNPSNVITASQLSNWTPSSTLVYAADGALKFNTGSKFTGSITLKTPLDVSGNNGVFDVKIKAVSWAKDNTTVKVRALSGGTELESLTHQFANGSSPYNDETFEEYTYNFTKGNASTVIEITGSKRFFVTEVTILQEVRTVPTLVLSSESYDFGKVITGETGNSTGLTITGENLTSGITATVGGEQAGDFTASIEGENVNLTFAPQSTGIRKATVTFSSEGAADVVLNVTGEGVEASTPIIGIEGGYSLDNPLALSLNLGTAATTSASVDVTLANITTDPTVTIVPEAGTGEGIFTEESLFDPINGTGLVEVKFQPAETGEYAAVVTLTSGSVSESFRVTGNCVKPRLEVVSAYDFGIAGMGQNTAYELVVKGSDLVNDVVLNWAEGTNTDAVFAFTPASLTKEEVMSEAGAKVTVTFTPKAVQRYTGQLVLAPQSGNIYAYAVNFTGEGKELPKYTWTEDFEEYSAQTNYNATYTSSTGRKWQGADGLVGNLTGDKKNGKNSVRLRNSGTFELLTPKSDGVGTLALSHAYYGSDAGSLLWSLSIKQNDGAWEVIADSLPSQPELKEQEFVINKTGDIYVKMTLLNGGKSNRLSIDDVKMTDYISTDPELIVTGETDFGKYEIGQPALVKDIVIKGRNLSEGELNAAWVGTGGVFSTDLSQLTVSAVSAENGYVMHVSFAPTAAGEYTDSLLIRGAGLMPVVIGFKGTAALPVPEIAADPAELNFGKVVMGTTETMQVKITGRNLDRDLKVTSSDDMFVCTADNLPADAVMSETGYMLDVMFAPTAFRKDAYTGIVTVTYDETNFIQIALTGVSTDPNANDGSADKPFAVEEAIDNQGKQGAWVRGFILGSTNDGSTIAASAVNTNVLLGNAATGYTFTLPVQLPSGAVRDQLNVKDNPANVGKEVLIQADLTAYFGNTPGAKNASDFKWVKSSTEITENTQIDTDAAYDEMVVSTPGITVSVAPSSSVTAEQLTLPVASDGEAAQVELGQGASFTANRLIVEKSISQSGEWHFLSMPFQMNTDSIKVKTGGRTAVLEKDIRILTYDTQKRAEGAMDQVWQKMTAPGVLPANTGFALQISQELAREKSPLLFISSQPVSFTGENLNRTLTNHPSENLLDQFVSFLGIPYLSQMGSQSLYVSSGTHCVALYQYDPAQDLYYTRLYTDTQESALHPCEGVFMQAGQADDQLTYHYLSSSSLRSLETPYPRVQLTLDQDQAFIVFDEQASGDFRVNEDGIKIPPMKDTTPMLYIQSTTGEALSVSVEPESDRLIRLGVRPGTLGNHTLALGQETSYQATAIELRDAQSGACVDLLKGSYTFTAEQPGEQKDRFTLRVVKSPSALSEYRTGDVRVGIDREGRLTLEGVQAGTPIRVVDLQGRLIRSVRSDGNSLTLEVGKGLYLVCVGETWIKVMR